MTSSGNYQVSVVNTQRDEYWDSLKFILITLVVLGHFSELCNPVGSMNRVIFNFIYLFHMPLFVFVSGRFSHMKEKAKYRESIYKLLETFIVFQLLASIWYSRYSFEALFTPWFHLWYLLSLVYYRLIVYCCPPPLLLNNKRVILVLSIVISLVGGFVPIGRLLSIQRTLALLPFFVMGFYSVDYDIKRLLSRIPFIVAVLTLILLIVLLSLYFNMDITRILVNADSYYTDDIKETLLLPIFRGLYIVFAICISMAIMRVALNKTRLAIFGRYTMNIYVYHALFLLFFQASIIRSYLPSGQILVLIYALITIFFLTFLSRFALLRDLLNPLSLIKNIWLVYKQKDGKAE